MSDQQITRIDTLCAKRGVQNNGDTPSRSKVIREAVEFYLDHLEETGALDVEPVEPVES